MRATWRVMLDGSREEALLAVDLYNQPRQPRRLQAYFVHMHLAWLYLFHARFKRDKVDYRYKLKNGRLDRIDGEPKTWDLTKCAAVRWPNDDAVKANLQLSIGLRNKVEHRYHEAITQFTTGYAQALLLNYEQELTDTFGSDYSLGEQLRFPIFVGSITALGQAKLKQLRDELPRDARDFVATFEAGLSSEITSDRQCRRTADRYVA